MTATVLVAFLAGLFGFLYFHSSGESGSQPSPAAPARQELPPPNDLVLPPPAPLPPHTRIPRPSHIRPTPNVQKRIERAIPAPTPSQTVPPKLHIPSKWEIINESNQIIELDDKYYRVAVKSDQYGYKNQAIIYYKKYIFVAPTGPRADEVRTRLSQLESSY